MALRGCSGSELYASEDGVGDLTCPEATLPDLPHLLQDSVSLTDCNDMTCDPQEEQTEYHSVVCGGILESHSCGTKERVCPNLLVCDSLEHGEVKDILLIEGMLPPQITTSEEVSGKNDRHIPSVSVKRSNPLLPPRERAPAVATEVCECVGDSYFSGCEESTVSTGGASCTDFTAKGAEAQFPVSAILISKNPFFGLKVADKSLHGNTSCPNLELEHRETLKSVARVSTITQTVDVSSDFRTCFTTSRSTSTQVCLSSRAINTEITMMNKSRPAGWRCETCADVVCNADWLFGAGSVEEIWSQLPETLEKHLDGNTATADRSLQIQKQWKSRNELCSSDLKMGTDRPVHLNKQDVKNSASSCCQKILQRAIEAELQILNTHYHMCSQHCLKIYLLALEESTCSISYFHRCSGNTELGLSLKVVLEDLRKNYNSMRMKIKMGVPLNALPPLSVETKLFPMSSYVPCKDNLQTICLTEGGQPSDCISSETFEEQREDQGVECGCVKKEEGNDYWFDAKEDLTGADFSVISEETKKQEEKKDMVDLIEVKVMESGNECSFIRVGGLSSSVSEDDLRSHFQKYQIADILTYADSGNYRCTFLCVKDTNKAKAAVEEINQQKIKGKIVSVELVNNASEDKSLVSQILTSKLWHEVQPVNNNQRNDQDKTPASASNSVKAPDATSVSEKEHLLPVTSLEISCSTQVPLETKCPGLKSSAEDFSLQANQKVKNCH
ncbi:PREDICTED: RNA-binding protein 44 [Pterocles gutturalis]|uniref:RNA-binding protein 44 n=1 Tax=Pterocles gutturalis TaxID=240206 RepID=UPI000528CC21|nr:PREDICTED: RNA-binding protein 44 [Pterocles gutturalis]